MLICVWLPDNDLYAHRRPYAPNLFLTIKKRALPASLAGQGVTTRWSSFALANRKRCPRNPLNIEKTFGYSKRISIIQGQAIEGRLRAILMLLGFQQVAELVVAYLEISMIARSTRTA